MKPILILLLSYFFMQIKQTSCILQVIKPEVYYIIRNRVLKKIIYDDASRAKIIIKSTKLFYNKILSKYYEMNANYYSLSEEDRTIIETIISLTY
jgi:hypothetical protein